jgi:hypothetical protein
MWSAILNALVSLLGWLSGKKQKAAEDRAQDAGVQQQKLADATATLKQTETAHEIEDHNRAGLHDGDAAKRLHEQWQRKD